MELIRGLQNLQSRYRGCVATIGNFDGVHLGHQAVVDRLRKAAERLNVPATAVLFEPQPLEFLRPNGAPARLMRLREKVEVLARCGVDRVLCVRFDDDFAELSPEGFVERILVDGLAVQYVVVGDDFRFGAARRGDIPALVESGRQHHFEVEAMESVMLDEHRISSTRIRHLLAVGDLSAAARMLGRPYSMSGHVAHGDKRGRTLGVPTANIHVLRRRVPLSGIYVVEVLGFGTASRPAVASIGTRPTVDGTHPLLEVHLLDCSQDLYGARLTVNFLHKLRDEQRFDSLSELRAAMERDIASARAFFRENHPDLATKPL